MSDNTIQEIHYCLCGCQQEVFYDRDHCKWNRYIKGHYKTPRKIYPIGEAPECACGCSAKTKWNQKKKRWNKLADHDNQSPEYKAYFSKKGKEVWTDPILKQKQSDKFKEITNRPEHKERVRQQSIERWQNQEYRDNIVNQIKERTNTKKHKEMVSQRTKDLWATSEYRESVMAKLSDPKMKAQISNSVKKLWTNPEYRQSISDKVKALWQNPEYRESHVQDMLDRWADPILSQVFLTAWNKCPNKLEGLINNLTSDKIKYIGNHKWWRTLKIIVDGKEIIKRKNPDFLIESKNAIIEIHGDYFHKNDYDDKVWIEAWAKIGYRCLIIWEHEIKQDIESVLNRIADFAGEQNWQMSLNI